MRLCTSRSRWRCSPSSRWCGHARACCGSRPNNERGPRTCRGCTRFLRWCCGNRGSRGRFRAGYWRMNRCGRRRWRNRPRRRNRRMNGSFWGRGSWSMRGSRFGGGARLCRCGLCLLFRFGSSLRGCQVAEVLSHALGLVVFERTRVGFLLFYPNLRQVLDQHLRLDLKLSREFVDANLARLWHSLSLLLPVH